MGWGDELMAAGQARALHALDGRRVQIVDRHGRARSHDAWRGNPRIAGATEEGDFHRLENGPNCRPYHVEVTRERYRFRRDFRAQAGELYFDPVERAFAAMHDITGQVVIGCDLKSAASPNKLWGKARWREFVTLALRAGHALVQLTGPQADALDPRVRRIKTATMRLACAVLANARAYVGQEGGLHHAAAALGVPGVVIFGGFTPLELTGYALHRNLGVEFAQACGMRTACPHCAAEMARITPGEVLAELEGIANETGGNPMKQCGGIWLPDHEEHLLPFLMDRGKWIDGRGTYQRHKLEAALGWCKQFRTAIDVGAHVGLWSMQLVKRFQRVFSFEPIAEHRACFERNLAGAGNYTLVGAAVGALPGAVDMHTTMGSSGDSWVKNEVGGEVQMVRLDDQAGAFGDVDFIKLDCEGYELFALRGGEALLKRSRPCVIVEQKPGRAQKWGLEETGAVDYLRGLGAHLRATISGDYILSWD